MNPAMYPGLALYVLAVLMTAGIASRKGYPFGWFWGIFFGPAALIVFLILPRRVPLGVHAAKLQGGESIG